ncbi:MAG TPA: TOPRIM nucleotidyl transferase/hydrolase domain-containing protein [Gaiellaceae bacterium]|nr:TOPRIM nucleotidyl transferase/hydrolase domain-containing protein [Gaiellaceae bacterium]
MSAVILVEGDSDRVAVETLALRRGRDFAAEGVSVVAIGGAQAIGRFRGDVGLCDAGEEAVFRRALGANVFVCVADLEDELIRALGPERVEEILDANGDLRPFRTMQKQVVWRGRPVSDQLRRFIASGARRKIRYARFLVEALDLDRVPRPLDGVLEHTFVAY